MSVSDEGRPVPEVQTGRLDLLVDFASRLAERSEGLAGLLGRNVSKVVGYEPEQEPTDATQTAGLCEPAVIDALDYEFRRIAHALDNIESDTKRLLH